MHQISKQPSRRSETSAQSRFTSKKERYPESTIFGVPIVLVHRIGTRNRIVEYIGLLATVTYPLLGGCSEGAVPGADGGNWLESSSLDGTQDSNDTLIPTTQGDTLSDPPDESDDDSADGSDDLPSIEESSASESSSSTNSDDTNEGTTSSSESTSTGDPEEGTESDTEDSESTSSTSGSDDDETNSSDSDSEESTDESDSTSSTSSSESTESSTSESSSDDTEPPSTSEETEDEGTESTGDDDIDCDNFVNMQYRAVNAKFSGWTTLSSSNPAEQTVLQPFNPEGTVDFTIQIPCRDNWYIWIRAYDEFNDDSFRVQVDGSPSTPSEFEVDCNPGGNQYRWTPLHFKKSNSSPCEREEDPWVQQWDPGDHHLIVYPLNAPVLSRIMVSNNPDFVPQ